MTSDVLDETRPLPERMTLLCKETVAALDCDRASIFVRDGQQFRGTFNWGNPPQIAEWFPDFRFGFESPTVREIFRTGTSTTINDAPNHPEMRAVAQIAVIESIVFAPVVDEAGNPLAVMTAEFNERLGSFTEPDVRVVTDAAAIVESSLRAALDPELTAAKQRELFERLAATANWERQQISTKIHDDALQRVIAVMYRIEGAAEKAEVPELHDELLSIAADAQRAAHSLRDVMHDVDPASVEVHGLAGALERTLSRVEEDTDLSVTFVNRQEERAPAPVAHVLYRASLEAVENVRKHAHATHLHVEVRRAPGAAETSVSIEDDGRGFEQSATLSGGNGLAVMQERILAANGVVQLDSTPGVGTRVRFKIPDGPQ